MGSACAATFGKTEKYSNIRQSTSLLMYSELPKLIFMDTEEVVRCRLHRGKN